LLVASGHSATQYTNYDFKGNGWTVVAINNGWKACAGQWDYWIKTVDYKGMVPDQLECNRAGTIVDSISDQLRIYGGHQACGYSITLGAGYWTLAELRPSYIGFLGADMNYTPDKDGNTHFYGKGHDIRLYNKPDPDRMAEEHRGKRKGAEKETPEEYLYYIYQRLYNIAKDQRCDVFNVSVGCDTRLPYPRELPKVITRINSRKNKPPV